MLYFVVWLILVYTYKKWFWWKWVNVVFAYMVWSGRILNKIFYKIRFCYIFVDVKKTDLFKYWNYLILQGSLFSFFLCKSYNYFNIDLNFNINLVQGTFLWGVCITCGTFSVIGMYMKKKDNDQYLNLT